MPRAFGPWVLLALVAVLLLPACAPDSPTDSATSEPAFEMPLEIADELLRIDGLLDLRGIASDPAGVPGALSRASSNTVTVPAGSVDAIAVAIAAAGSGGCVILASGDHFVSERVLVEQRVCIVGETGAVVRTSVGPSPVIDAVFHLRGADRASIWGVTIRPDGPIGNAAIMVENSPGAVIAMNTLQSFVQSIGIEGSDHVKIWNNTIEASAAWMDGVSPISFGVNIFTGRYTTVTENTFSQAFFGLWACDAKGQVIGNTFAGNYIGLILCKIPSGAYFLPDGREIYATLPATRWLVVGNEATGNFDVGYLAIDGATGNVLVDNAAANNGNYDLELAGDSYRFGFLTPRSSQTIAVAGEYRGLKVKDCGEDNQLLGFDAVVDNAVDPCF